MPSMSSLKRSSTCRRRTFNVGVSRPLSVVRSPSISSVARGFSWLGSLSVRAVTRRRNSSASSLDFSQSATSPGHCISFPSSSTCGSDGLTSSVTQGRLSPSRTACSNSGSARMRPSMGCGATFLPPRVTMMSLMRSVMTRNPSTSTYPASPVCSQPSESMAAAVASSLFQYPAITFRPRNSTSPCSPMCSCPPLSTRPAVPILNPPGELKVTSGEASVSP